MILSRLVAMEITYSSHMRWTRGIALGALGLVATACSGAPADEAEEAPGRAESQATASESASACDLNAIEKREAQEVADEWDEIYDLWAGEGVLTMSIESYDETLTTYSETGPSDCVESDEFEAVLEAWVTFHAGALDEDPITPSPQDASIVAFAFEEWREAADIPA